MTTATAWDYFKTELPTYFHTSGDGSIYRQDIKDVITQLAQLTAWTWTSLLTETDRGRVKEEQKLKETYSDLLQYLAMHTTVFEHYDGVKQEAVKAISENLKALFLGNSIPEYNGSVTLDRVIDNLSHSGGFVFTRKPNFTKKFIFLARIGITGGTMIDPWEEEQSNAPIENRFLLYLCVAPRPALTEHTIMEQQLRHWAINGGTEGQYIPPAFLPLGAC